MSGTLRHEHFGPAIRVNFDLKISQQLRRIRPAERFFSLARQFVSSVAIGERKSPQQAAGSKKFLSAPQISLVDANQGKAGKLASTYVNLGARIALNTIRFGDNSDNQRS